MKLLGFLRSDGKRLPKASCSTEDKAGTTSARVVAKRHHQRSEPVAASFGKQEGRNTGNAARDRTARPKGGPEHVVVPSLLTSPPSVPHAITEIDKISVPQEVVALLLLEW